MYSFLRCIFAVFICIYNVSSLYIIYIYIYNNYIHLYIIFLIQINTRTFLNVVCFLYKFAYFFGVFFIYIYVFTFVELRYKAAHLWFGYFPLIFAIINSSTALSVSVTRSAKFSFTVIFLFL